MRIIFFGTPDYVVPVVEKLNKSLRTDKNEPAVVAVVTQPPRPSGRKQKLEYSPVDVWAHKKKIPVLHRANEIIEQNIEADIGVLASYGELIPKSVINHFKYGILNIHPSLLPKWRGSSPVQATIIEGKQAGATIIKIDEKMDHGPILSQFKEEIIDSDTTKTLRDRLFFRSADVLSTLIPAYIKGKVHSKSQDDKKATYTKMVKKDDAYISPEYLKACLQGRTLKANWNIPFMKDFSVKPSPASLNNFIRAMQPWPQAWTFVRLNPSGQAKRLKILSSHLENKSVNGKRKTENRLVLDKVQLEGKNPVSWKQFLEGYPNYSFKNNLAFLIKTEPL
jgi:methionyl-tRNA formyltransferase